MNQPLAIALLLAAVVAWTSETIERTRLTARIENIRVSNHALGNLREEHERWQRREPFGDELLSLRRDAAELAGLRREMADREQFATTGGLSTPASATSTDPFPVGAWIPRAAWKNLGFATPLATLATALWAATTGETGVWPAAFDLGLNSRTKTEEAAPRPAGPTRAPDSPGEGLLAGWVARHIEVQEVQLLGEQRQGLDDSVLYLAVKAGPGETKTVYLQFRRVADAWRLVVPGRVVEQARLELASVSPAGELPR